MIPEMSALTEQVYLKAGFPPLQRSGFLQALQSWLQRVGSTTDFQYIMLSAMFLPQQSVSLVGPVLAAPQQSCCCIEVTAQASSLVASV